MPSPRASRSVRVANPLSAILVFLGFCEVTTGVAATVTSAAIQAAFTVFSLAFPVVVIVGFGVFLWKKPAVLYAPGDYSEETPIQAFADATGSRGVQASIEAQNAAMHEIVVSAVESTIEKYRPVAGGANDDVTAIARTVADEEISKRAVMVDLPFRDPPSGPFAVPVADTSVDQFLNTLFYALGGLVRPNTYGVDWVLVDRTSGKDFLDIGTRYASQVLEKLHDDRPLAEAGIVPGSHLMVTLIK